jgi:radical SAM superfamily enzyme YgiQ (UPF0313 family)
LTSPFKVLLVAPISEGFQGRNHVFSLPFLSLPTLAAYMPEGTEVEIAHEKHTTVNYDGDYDMVAITVMTPCAPRGYEIADRFRAKGVPVVLGGVHTTVMPDEASEHADAICIGEGEAIWPTIVEDCRAGTLKSVYTNPNIGAKDFTLRTPRRELTQVGQYYGGTVQAHFMETTRGCPYDCDFCAVTTFFGQRYRTRTVDEIETEINDIGIPLLKRNGKRSFMKHIIAFTDDNFFGAVKHSAAVLEMLRKYDVRWFGQTTLRMTDRPELLELCRASGCLGFEIGFESLAPRKYRKSGWDRSSGLDQEQYFIERCHLLHSYGIGINGSMIFGQDEDELDVFQRYVDFIQKARINTPYLTILTPYPGTPLYYKFQEDGRLLHREWEKYDTAHCVFQPTNMTPEQLEAGYRWAWRQVTAHHRALARNLFAGGLFGGPLFRFWGAAALGFRMSTRAEHGDKERRHPSRLEGLDQKYLPPPREHDPVMPDHILDLRAMSSNLRERVEAKQARAKARRRELEAQAAGTEAGAPALIQIRGAQPGAGDTAQA